MTERNVLLVRPCDSLQAKLWLDLLKISMTTGEYVSAAVREADEGLKAFLDRFPDTLKERKVG